MLLLIRDSVLCGYKYFNSLACLDLSVHDMIYIARMLHAHMHNASCSVYCEWYVLSAEDVTNGSQYV